MFETVWFLGIVAILLTVYAARMAYIIFFRLPIHYDGRIKDIIGEHKRNCANYHWYHPRILDCDVNIGRWYKGSYCSQFITSKDFHLGIYACDEYNEELNNRIMEAAQE